jgi:hypothetical protein
MVARTPPQDLRTSVFIDESTTTKHRYLVIGGLVIPSEYAALFEAEMIEARGDLLPTISQQGKPRIIKWQKAKGHDHLEGYGRVIDSYFRFPQKYKMPSNLNVHINCIAVDTSTKDYEQYNEGDADLGFNKQVNYLCVRIIGRKHKTSLFSVYPDKRTTKQDLLMAQSIMNFSAAKYKDEYRFMPFRRLEWAEPEQFQALQVVDIFIGALAYKLNGHYEAPNANFTKKGLCDKILKWAKIGNVFQNTPIYLPRLTLYHRNHSPFKRER